MLIARDIRAVARLVVAGCLAFAAQANASYLHMSDARPAAQKYFARYGFDESLNTTLGSCSRATSRIVRCDFMVSDYDGLSSGQEVAVITLRTNRVYGHVSEGGHRYFLLRLRSQGS